MGQNLLSKTFRPWSDRPLELEVEAGQVACPSRGIVDVERCFTCLSYRSYRDGPPEQLRCTPRRPSLLEDAPFGFVPR
jgi:hypothetical protein